MKRLLSTTIHPGFNKGRYALNINVVSNSKRNIKKELAEFNRFINSTLKNIISLRASLLPILESFSLENDFDLNEYYKLLSDQNQQIQFVLLRYSGNNNSFYISSLLSIVSNLRKQVLLVQKVSKIKYTLFQTQMEILLKNIELVHLEVLQKSNNQTFINQKLKVC